LFTSLVIFCASPPGYETCQSCIGVPGIEARSLALVTRPLPSASHPSEPIERQRAAETFRTDLSETETASMLT
jgi:hypothetical protein